MLKILLAVKESLEEARKVLDGHDVDLSAGEKTVEAMLSGNHYDLVILEDGVDTIPKIKALDPRTEVIFITDRGLDEVQAIGEGASECLRLPLDAGRLKASVEKVSDMVELRKETARLEKKLYEKYTFGGIVGKNPQMLDIFGFLRRVAPYFKTVTVFGETGTGKEEIAKVLHSISPVADRPFIVCNCGGLVENLIESELFGHRKGSFTGAIADKAGIFEAAGDGTVLLDEIGELPLGFQPHLLRVLQNGDFRRLGSNPPLKARCRVIAATSRDLKKDITLGRFREDLYFRLTPLKITVPPLRERKDDIPYLSRFLLERACERTGKKVYGFSRPAQRALMAHNWPGNVRELDNVIEQVVILARESFVRFEDLPPHIRDAGGAREFDSLPDNLDEAIRTHLEKVLQKYAGNRTSAARALGITRRSLLRRMDKYGLR